MKIFLLHCKEVFLVYPMHLDQSLLLPWKAVACEVLCSCNWAEVVWCDQVNLQVHVLVGSGEFSGAVVGGCNQVQLKCAHSAMHFTAHNPPSQLLQLYQSFRRFF